MATNSQIRTVGLDLQGKVEAFKTALDAIQTVTTAWVLNDVDGSLPTDVAVKDQLAAYDALSKPAINMTDALSAIRTAGA
jgi:hypothetical protein